MAADGVDNHDVMQLVSVSPIPVEGRANMDVGGRCELAMEGGICLGDDISWRGCKVTRCVALQTAGSGGCLTEWGRRWGVALGKLGADVGALTETRIATLDGHTLALNGLTRPVRPKASLPETPQPITHSRNQKLQEPQNQELPEIRIKTKN